ncbi:MAG: radical SAM protein [Sulfolobales archaeon]|nr:radical SAM protein [Sulfolobales archaeon]MDW8083473.1 radical SAM protein [Sulfolobales archaeon]
MVREKLSWYYDVMVNKVPAKFVLARYVGVKDGLGGEGLEELWELHDSLSREFRKLLNQAKNGKLNISEVSKLEKPNVSYLDVKIEIARRIVEKCHFCEWRCGVNRLGGSRGFCRLTSETYVSSYFLHVGEEPPLVPSGTIFYGSCNFRCVFCQNHDISQEYPFSGIRVTAEELASIQDYLRVEGARNINHVGGEPTPNIYTILSSLKYVRNNVPQLWNSNMYLTEEAMKLLLDVIDIWLPDFKYGNNSCAARLSLVKNYFNVVARNLKMVCDSRDPIIIRHLVMPNHIDCCTTPVLEWIAIDCPTALVNIMEQYRPEYLVLRHSNKYSDIARRLTREELYRAYEIARKLKIDFEDVS